MLDIETIILQYLLFNREYFERVIPYLDYKLFESLPHKFIAKTIATYFTTENDCIPFDILGVRIQNLEKVNAETINSIKALYNNLKKPDNSVSVELIIKETEKYFKQRKIWTVISNGIEEYDSKKDFSTNFLSEAEDAIAYSFNEKVGYDYLENIKERFELYRQNIVKIPTSIDILNEKTNGGIQCKTLNACISATNGGKSVWLCQEAAFNLKNGKNVLYITLEMSEVEIAKRIDANLLDIKQDSLATTSYESANLRMKQLLDKTQGRLFIQEFPADSTTVLDIRNIIDKIRRKHKVKIDMLVVDYLGLLCSYRYSAKNNNSYAIGKHTAEELRSLAVQYNIPIWTAIQFNRGAENPEDVKSVGMEKTSDSYGIPMTLDFLFAILHTDQLDLQGKTVFKILKTRYGASKNTTGMFTVLQNWGCARFENDPNQINLNEKDDTDTKDGKKIDSVLKKQTHNDIKEEENNKQKNDTNTIVADGSDLFG